jgi:hypothetical protein
MKSSKSKKVFIIEYTLDKIADDGERLIKVKEQQTFSTNDLAVAYAEEQMKQQTFNDNKIGYTVSPRDK